MSLHYVIVISDVVLTRQFIATWDRIIKLFAVFFQTDENNQVQTI